MDDFEAFRQKKLGKAKPEADDAAPSDEFEAFRKKKLQAKQQDKSREDAESMKGELHLDRPTQVLHFKLDVSGLDADDIADIKLHRSIDGPVIALLGSDLAGSVAIPNSELEQLADSKLAVVIYTESAPHGFVRGRLERR